VRPKRFLLTNDDGIDAPGLAALEAALSSDCERSIVAPAEAQSGSGHAVTTNGPLRLEQRGEYRWAAHGTPADCVRAALHCFPGQFDFVLAGVNSGGNLGVDVYHSGTVAAVREAAVHGLPGAAFSHYRNRSLDEADWSRAAEWVRRLLDDGISEPAPGSFWNVNFPCLDSGAVMPERVDCPLDPSPLPLSYRSEGELLHYDGVYRDRARRVAHDVDICFGGRIAVTKLRVGQ